MTRAVTGDVDAEREILGACLLDAGAYAFVADVLTTGEEWSVPAHAEVWRAMRALAAAKSQIDTTSVRGQLVVSGRLGAAGGDEALLGLTDIIPNVEAAEARAKRVRDLAAVRAVRSSALRVAAEAGDPLEDVRDFLDRAEGALGDACNLRTPTSVSASIADVVADAYGHVLTTQRSSVHLTGYQTGFRTLDYMLSGLAPGDLYVVAGRPGHGKSALSMQVALGLSQAEGLPAVFFSLEMPSRQLGQRMLASEAVVPLGSVRTGRISVDDGGRLSRTAAELAERRVWVVDAMRLTIHDVRRECRRIARKHGKLGVVVIDYVQLLRPVPASHRRSREEEVAESSRESKAIARELGCPVVLCAQLNRGVEQRGSEARPRLSDLRESGALEQDADAVIFVHRPEKANPHTAEKGIAEIIVDKQRNGPTGVVRMLYRGEYTRFENLDENRGAA